jgi:hypothetical protein
MADHDQTLAPADASLRARTTDWFVGTRLAELIDTIRSRPDTLGTFVVVLVTIAIYLFTSSRDRQNLDYFVRLADAFLHGRIYLTEAPPWLNELIPKDGVWYVAYPPFPGVLLVPFVALFGPDFPPQIASCIFGGFAVGLAWLVFGRFALTGRVRLGLTIAFGFGTVLWYVAEVGSVWYFSHVVAVMCSMAAILFVLERRWPILVGLLLGCAAISRLPVGLTAPFFFALIVGLGWPPRLPARGTRQAAIRNGLAFLVGIGIPTAIYLAYNYARWGTILDQSYVLIPGVLEDPVYAGHGILSIEYIPRHIYAIFLRTWNFVDDAPFFQPSWWGLSLFLTTPLFLWLVKARLRDPRVAWAWVGTGLALIPIVTHGNVGFTQFGYRFSLDVQPLLFVILATVFERGMGRWAWAATAVSVLVCAYGIWAIGIGFVEF